MANEEISCDDIKCVHYDGFFDDNCGGQNMINCPKTLTEPENSKTPQDGGNPSTDLLCAMLRVEHEHMTLRTPEGWLLWSQKVTSETSLGDIINRAIPNIGYKQGT